MGTADWGNAVKGGLQNRCLEIVAVAYKAIPIEVLQVETMMASMQKYFDLLQARARA